MIRLLIVDDEPSVLAALRRELRHQFADELVIETCADPALALARVRAQAFDIVMSDLRMPEIDGLSFLSLVSAILPASVRIVLTGSADFGTAQRAINDAGVFRYLTKPWTEAELRSHLAAAIAIVAAARRQARAAATAAADAEDAQSLERRRLEAIEPGITAVEWGPAGEVLMPPLQE
ncbi:MAG: response regulator [Burkholderiales bacterium]|nr:response regulator [Burkholderiales bacterium]